MRSHRRKCVVLMVTVIVLSSTSHWGSAQSILPLDQERRVDGFVIVPQCGGNTFDSEEAPGFDPFSGSLQRELECATARAVASSVQQSRIGGYSIVGEGGSLSEADATILNTIHAITSSYIGVTFELSGQAVYALQGSMSLTSSDPQSVSAYAEIRLFDSQSMTLAGQTLFPSMPEGPTTALVHETGILDVGVYTLRARTQTVVDNAVPPTARADGFFRVVLAVGVGDFDTDVDVDLDDFAAFLPCLMGPNVQADVTCALFDFDFDGDVDVADFAGIQSLFTGSL